VIDIPEEAQLNPPTNKVHKTEAGHKIEFDNTKGSERINIEHKNGSKITIDEDISINHNNNSFVKIDDIGVITITGTKIKLNGY
jgi:TFIIF-interacting CTD phosphatase-like protein